MYGFLKLNEFVDKKGGYFKEKDLHIASNVQTIGKIVYTPDKILLESLAGSQDQVIVKVLSDIVPGDGSYIQVYGSLSFFRDRGLNYMYNFEEECDISGDLFFVLNIICWTDLENEIQARRFEELLYKINNIPSCK